MTESNTIEKISIIDLFKNSNYIIPIYQRNYAWGQVEIEQLLTDIYSFDGGNYYLGSLIVNKNNDDDYEVIVGQQRLTTLFLLVSYLGISPNLNSLKFETRDKSNKTLNKIIELSKNKYVHLEDPSYSQEILNGLSIIDNYFKTKNTTDTFLNDYKNKLKMVSLVRTQVPEKIDLNHYFEVMNTRGEQLEAHEILKARIIDKISDNQKKVAAYIWDACSQMDKYVQMNFSKDFREKIFYKGNDLNFKINEFTDNYDAIFKLITVQDYAGFPSEQNTLKSILENANSSNLKDNNINDKEESSRFESIITFPNFLLQVNALTKLKTKKEENSSYTLDDKKLLSEINCKDEHEAKEFIYNLLKYRYLFDKYIIKREYSSKDGANAWSLKTITSNGDDIYYINTYSEDAAMQSNLILLQSSLRITYTSPQTMYWLTEALINVNLSANLLVTLENYCHDKAISTLNDKEGFAIERIAFTYLDYLLVMKYEEHKKANNDRDYIKSFLTSLFSIKEDEEIFLNFLNFIFSESANESVNRIKECFEKYECKYRTSIEHFFPQNPNKGSPKVSNLDNFGNLALITVSANSIFSNLSPEIKYTVHWKLMQLSPKLMLMGILFNYAIRDNQNDLNKIEDCICKFGKVMINLIESSGKTNSN